MYRYRANHGSTRASLNALKHLPKIGKPIYVKGYTYKGRYNTNHTAVLVVGNNGSIRFDGFAWGYNGEGPRGLNQLLTKLGLSKEQIFEFTLKYMYTFDWKNIGEIWRINLTF
jgi:hypothetical protein